MPTTTEVSPRIPLLKSHILPLFVNHGQIVNIIGVFRIFTISCFEEFSQICLMKLIALIVITNHGGREFVEIS